MGKQFVHLHTHSHYSLLDGAAKIPDLVKSAAAFGMPALALTDHGNMFGSFEFYQEARKAGIKPIIGFEAYVAAGSRLVKDKENAKPHHLTLLAKNYAGYLNLLQIASEAYLNGFYYKPRVDKEFLSQHSQGLIVLSGCLASEICTSLVEDKYQQAQRSVSFFKDVFKDNFYIELQKNKIVEQEKANAGLMRLAQEFKLPMVLTNDIHYLKSEDARPHDILLCIQTATTVDDPNRWRFGSQEFYLKSPEQMYEDGKEFPEAVENSLNIAAQVNIEIPMGKNHLPPFTPPNGKSNTDYLRELCEKGLAERYPQMAAEIRARFEREFGVICQMGFATYFLIVWDFINYARSQGIPVGPGRGSAAGSLVAYALRITNLDPLRYNLLFERFLNEGRKDMPDIDIDFETERRGEVIEYVTKKYGQDRVSQIITFGTLAARAVIRDVGRAMKIPLPDVDKVAKKVPTGLKMTLEKALETDGEFRQVYESEPRFKDLIDVAKRLEGLNRQPGIHAAGVLISDQDLTSYVPLYKNVDGAVTTQYSMDHLGTLGLLKMDFLGLSTLSLIQKAIAIIKGSCGEIVDMEKLPLDDQKTYDLLTRGDTDGVFQLESEGMRELIKKLKPDRFEDVIALVALYRPGPLQSGMVDTFCLCKHGLEQPVYKHPVMEQVLSETYGVMLYQEQAMQIAKDLSGFSLTEADSLRKAMGKKKKDIMDNYRKKFVEAAGKIHQVTPETAAEIFDLIDKFSGYGFNKSHSAAYALVTYQTAYLKAHYPVEFMAALMTIESQNTDKVVRYLHVCDSMKIPVLPPDINYSEASFSVVKGQIRFGMAAIKGLGDKAIEMILAARQEVGKFTTIFHLCEHVTNHALDKRVLEALTKSGSLDCLGRPRSQLFETIPNAIQWGTAIQKQKKSNQMTMFDEEAEVVDNQSGSSGFDHLYVVPKEPWSKPQELVYEKETLGFFLSDHPLKRWGKYIQKLATHKLSSLKAGMSSSLTVGGLIVSLRDRPVKSGQNQGRKMAYLVIEDLSGSCPVVCFPDAFEKFKDFLETDEVVFIKGKMNLKKEEAEIIVDEIIPITKAIETMPQLMSLRIRENKSDETVYEVRKLCGAHRGECRLQLQVEADGLATIIEASPRYFIKPDCLLVEKLENVLGQDMVVLSRD